MASRVNVQFVTILVAALIVLAGAVGFVGYTMAKKTAAENIAEGDEFYARGEYEAANIRYSKGVNKERNNPEYLEKWIATLTKLSPESDELYRKQYLQAYVPALESYALATGELDAYERWLDDRWEAVAGLGRSSLDGLESFVEMTERAIEQYGEDRVGVASLMKYRGRARVRALLSGYSLTQEQTEQARTDLERALEAEPDDAEVVQTLAQWYFLAADQRRAQGVRTEAAELEARGMAVLDEFLESHPDDAQIKLAKLNQSVQQETRRSLGQKRWGQVLREYTDEVRSVVDTVLATPAEKLELSTVLSTSRMVLIAQMEDVGDIIERLFAHYMQANPADLEAGLAYGNLLQAAGRDEASIDAFEEIRVAPRPSLSLRGLVHNMFVQQAAGGQVQAAVALAGRAGEEGDEQAKERWLETARTYYGRYVEAAGQATDQGLFLRAIIAYEEGERRQARQLLNEYVTTVSGSNDVRALTMMGTLLMAEQKPGAAQRRFERVLELEPSNTRAIAGLAEVHYRLGERAQAMRYAQMLLEADPDNERVRSLVEQMQRESLGTASDDPVTKAVAQAQEALSGVAPDYEEAEIILRAAIDAQGPDMGLVVPMLSVLMVQDKIDQARELVDHAVEVDPENERLLAIRDRLASPDPVQAAVDQIMTADAPEADKRFQAASVYANAQMNDKYIEQIEAAVAAAPEDPRSIEYRFRKALEADDTDEARRVAELAGKQNVDGVNGLTYESRVAVFNKNFDLAVSLLEQALDRDEYLVSAWKQLGALMVQRGNIDRAISAYQRVVSIQPRDVQGVTKLVQTLAMRGDLNEALRIARDAQNFAVRDPAFVDVWLQLESIAPEGDPDVAVRVRTQLVELSPDNQDNLRALVRLQMQEGDFEGAKETIDQIREQDNTLDTAALEAIWHAEQGQIMHAAKVMEDYYFADEAHQNVQWYLTMAQILDRYEKTGLAVGVLEKGREFQDPTKLSCDRMIAQIYWNRRAYKGAAEAMEKVVGVVEDPEHALLLQYAECLMNLGRYEEAQARLEDVPAIRGDYTVLLLRAKIAMANDQPERARELIDRAISLDPENEVGFIQRAQLARESGDAAGLRDAEADLRQALKLNPKSNNATLMLASLYMNSNRWDDAMRQLETAVANDPANDELRRQYVTALTSRDPKSVRAMELVNEAIERKPNDVQWLDLAGAIYARRGEWERAAKMLRQAWETRPGEQTAGRYVDALLRNDPPQHAVALQVLATPQLNVEQSQGLLMLRAKAHAMAGSNRKKLDDIAAAYALLSHDNQRAVNEFFTTATSLANDADEAMEILNGLSQIKPFESWARYYAGQMLLQLPEQRSAAMADLESLIDDAQADDVKVAVCKLLGSMAHSQGELERSRSFYERGLKIAPDDIELNNNLAYLLADNMNQGEEALVYAQRAAELAPQSANILDTLGTVYLGLERYDEAAKVLERAERAARSPSERAPVLAHLAELEIADGSSVRAMDHLDELGDLIQRYPAIGQRYQEEHQRLVDQAQR